MLKIYNILSSNLPFKKAARLAFLAAFSASAAYAENIDFGKGNVVSGGGGQITIGDDNAISGGGGGHTIIGNWAEINGGGGANTIIGAGSNEAAGGIGATITDSRQSLVIGSGQVKDSDGAIVIGKGSVTNNGMSIGGGDASNGGLTIGGGSATGSGVSFGGDASDGQFSVGDRVITNVKDGVAKTDAVNVSQLDSAKADAINTSNNYTDSKITANNTVINKNITNAKNEAISTSNSYTDSKVTANNTVINKNITNAKNEAISTSNNYTNTKYEQSINYAQDAADNAEKKANDYTDNKFKGFNADFKSLDNKITKAENRLNAGIAGVTAIASIPYVTDNDFSYGIGFGNYANANAMAGGVQYKITPKLNARVNVSWDTEHNNAIGFGFAGGW